MSGGVCQISDTVPVMHNGRQVDGGLLERVFQHSESDSTRELTDAIQGRTTPVLGDAPAPARG